ncbi:NUDIX hydrolase [Streptomyces sp. PTM05]|uniref:NUDIX hydrolase n=1 Tax=Streptantibioticus parmotrematis TaxID=2873249 RepID=A0ABS7QWD0_9ACTN|nr:NUDIX hydrolase [Streptantibioticus parmotrematis]MBY8886079.1 NUDIX hydrolase [Streptantibioticus parmotrematis]
MRMHEDVELRCSTILFHERTVLLVHRTVRGLDDWVLPGGTPRPGESMASCARRETREETGLAVEPTRVAFVLEATDPDSGRRTVDLVFDTDSTARGQVARCLEPGMEPRFVPFTELRELRLRPPLAGHLPGFFTRRLDRYAPYLGNLWRPPDDSPDAFAGAPL